MRNKLDGFFQALGVAVISFSTILLIMFVIFLFAFLIIT